jgi:hypothetical protein
LEVDLSRVAPSAARCGSCPLFLVLDEPAPPLAAGAGGGGGGIMSELDVAVVVVVVLVVVVEALVGLGFGDIAGAETVRDL